MPSSNVRQLQPASGRDETIESLDMMANLRRTYIGTEPANAKWLWFPIQEHKCIHKPWQLPSCALWLMQIENKSQLKSEENRGFCLHGSGFHAQLTFYVAISCSVIVVRHGSNHGDHRCKSDSTKGRHNMVQHPNPNTKSIATCVFLKKNWSVQMFFEKNQQLPKTPKKACSFYVNIA